MGDKFTSSLSDAGELILLIQDFSLADVGEYKVIVENDLGAVSQIVRMEMSGINQSIDRSIDQYQSINQSVWRGGVVVRASDLQPRGGHRFKSRPLLST